MTTTTSETRYVSCADTAKEIRKALKAKFPGVKFSVRSSVYSMGASIDISWVDGPFADAVTKVARQFEGASFDGMIDLKSYHTSVTDTGEVVHWGADYVFATRSISPAYEAQLVVEVAEAVAQNPAECQMGSGPETYWVGVATRFGVFQQGNVYAFVRYMSQFIAPATVTAGGAAMTVRYYGRTGGFADNMVGIARVSDEPGEPPEQVWNAATQEWVASNVVRTAIGVGSTDWDNITETQAQKFAPGAFGTVVTA